MAADYQRRRRKRRANVQAILDAANEMHVSEDEHSYNEMMQDCGEVGIGAEDPYREDYENVCDPDFGLPEFCRNYLLLSDSDEELEQEEIECVPFKEGATCSQSLPSQHRAGQK